VTTEPVPILEEDLKYKDSLEESSNEEFKMLGPTHETPSSLKNPTSPREHPSSRSHRDVGSLAIKGEARDDDIDLESPRSLGKPSSRRKHQSV